jgi:hypothetical protein
MLAAFYLIVWRWLGTPDAAWALLRGDEVVVVPTTIDVGDCMAGDVKELQLHVVSMSSSPVTLTGMYTSCSCLLASSLPIHLEGRGESTLRLTIHASGDPGNFTRQAVLYTDSKVSPELPITVVGKILENNADLVPIPQPAEALTANDD